MSACFKNHLNKIILLLSILFPSFCAFAETIDGQTPAEPVVKSHPMPTKVTPSIKTESDENTAVAQNNLPDAPKTAYEAIIKGNAVYDQGNYVKAILYYNKAIDLQPDSTDAYYNRGHAYVKEGRYNQALLNFNKAIELKPDFLKAYSDRSNVYLYTKNFDQAIQDSNKAIELDPTLAGAYQNRSAAYNYKGNYQQAIVDSNKAIALRPDDAYTYAIRGYAYLAQGNYDQAIADCNKAIELNPKLPYLYPIRDFAISSKGQISNDPYSGLWEKASWASVSVKIDRISQGAYSFSECLYGRLCGKTRIGLLRDFRSRIQIIDKNTITFINSNGIVSIYHRSQKQPVIFYLWWVPFGILYVLGLYTLARKCNVARAWLAWVPLADFYVICKIGNKPVGWVIYYYTCLLSILIIFRVLTSSYLLNPILAIIVPFLTLFIFFLSIILLFRAPAFFAIVTSNNRFN